MTVTGALSEAERSDLIAATRRLARERLAPMALELANAHEWPEHLFELLRDHGYFELYYPRQYGGLGLCLPALNEIIEEMAAGAEPGAAGGVGERPARVAVMAARSAGRRGRRVPARAARGGQ